MRNSVDQQSSSSPDADRAPKGIDMQEDETTTAAAYLKEWITAQGCLNIDDNKKECSRGRLRGALRLLYMPWPKKRVRRSLILPFSKESFVNLERQLGLPDVFLANVARDRSVPTRFDEVAHPEGNRLGKLSRKTVAILILANLWCRYLLC